MVRLIEIRLQAGLKKQFNRIACNINRDRKCIADILAELIGLSEVFSDTDFFEVGGDSLLAARLINAIKTRFAVDITMRELFDSRTVSNISEIIDERSKEKMDEGEI